MAILIPRDDTPRCPLCGAETDTLYRREDMEIVGCPECVDGVDAWDWLEDHKPYYE